MKEKRRIYKFTVVIEPDEVGYHAYVPALPGCHTFGENIEEALRNIEEAMMLHVESMLADGESLPEEESFIITSVPVAV